MKSSNRSSKPAAASWSWSRLKIYAIPVIVSIALWYLLNSYIFNQVKNSKIKNSARPTREKVVFPDDATAKLSLTHEIAQLNYKSDRTKSIDPSYLCSIEDIEALIEDNNLKQATVDLNKLAKSPGVDPNCPHLVYLTAVLFDRLADHEKNNAKLKHAVQIFEKLVEMSTSRPVDDNLVYLAGWRLVERLEFTGQLKEAIKYTDLLLKRFKDNLKLLNRQGVNYLIVDRANQAKEQFRKVLNLTDRNDPFALCHYGFILKQNENKPNESIDYFRKCLLSREKSVMDGRFFYHIGDALQRINQTSEAFEFYTIAVENGVFPSIYQRSIYNERDLRAQPWWEVDETGYGDQLRELERNWETIRSEAVNQMNKKQNSFVSEDENLREKGEWKELALYARGKQVKQNCQKVPRTCELVSKIEAAKSCKRGQIKFSLLSPGVHIWPHCGPTNCRIRAHLGLKIPDGVFIRVVNETRTWREGEFIVFDDSFEHEVWHNGTQHRLVLILDLWHPDLDQSMRNRLSPI